MQTSTYIIPSAIWTYAADNSETSNNNVFPYACDSGSSSNSDHPHSLAVIITVSQEIQTPVPSRASV